MARMEKRLAAIALSKITTPGMYADGGGLYFRVKVSGRAQWVFRFRDGARRHDAGLGPYPRVTLKEAREKAEIYRKERLAGRNPLENKRAEKVKRRQEAASMVLFRQAASQYIAAHEPKWKNEKHRWQWRQTLETFAFPIIGDLPVAAVDTGHILQILEPHWLTQTETASRLRGRLERVLDWARVKGFRKGENPARWRGHLSHLLPEKAEVQKVEHHPAMPYSKIPGFMRELYKKKGSCCPGADVHDSDRSQKRRNAPRTMA